MEKEMNGARWNSAALALYLRIFFDSIYLRFFVFPRKRPDRIDIPTVFANFVENYGGEVCDRTPQQTSGKIADYVFRKQNVVAELKCLETDPYHGLAGGKRLWQDLRNAGMNENEIVQWARGRGRLSEKAVWHLATVFRKRIEKITRKAEKQVAATKLSYEMPTASGLILIANDNNYLFSYPQKHQLISDVFARHFNNSCIKGFVFFTPNVPVRIPNSLREWHPWTTAYSSTATDDFVAFVDDLGHQWQQLFFSEEKYRSPQIKTSDREFFWGWMANARNIDVRKKIVDSD
jgi:hypothetical protein